MTSPKLDQAFPKKVRLRKQAEFDAVYKGDAFAANDVLVIRGIRNKSNQTRLGLSVSKKVGNAVVRNKWKRTIRESFRKQRTKMPVGIDIVVRPKRGAVCSYEKVFRALPRLVERLDKRLGET